MYWCMYLLQRLRFLAMRENELLQMMKACNEQVTRHFPKQETRKDGWWWRQWWWRQWWCWWLQQVMLTARACNERVTRANFALLVLPRSTAGWSVSSLVLANRAVSWRLSLGVLLHRRNFPHVFFLIHQVTFSSIIIGYKERFEGQQIDLILPCVDSVLDAQITAKHGQNKTVDCQTKYCEVHRFSKAKVAH